MGKLPDFLIVGAQKCGTTSLKHNLNKHRDVYVPEYCVANSNQINFFDYDNEYSKGVDWYASLFKEGYVCGEKSVEYIMSDKAIRRIKKHVPEVKIILCVRNPVDRFISQLNMRKGGMRPISIDVALRDDEYIYRGMYFKQIKNLMKYFNREQIHIMVVDSGIDYGEITEKDNVTHQGYKVVDNSDVTKKNMDEVFNFIGVKPYNIEYDYMHVANNSDKIKVSDTNIDKLKKLYKKDVKQFFEFIGYEINSWKYD